MPFLRQVGVDNRELLVGERRAFVQHGRQRSSHSQATPPVLDALQVVTQVPCSAGLFYGSSGPGRAPREVLHHHGNFALFDLGAVLDHHLDRLLPAFGVLRRRLDTAHGVTSLAAFLHQLLPLRGPLCARRRRRKQHRRRQRHREDEAKSTRHRHPCYQTRFLRDLAEFETRLS